jgi:hypothetical protein
VQLLKRQGISLDSPVERDSVALQAKKRREQPPASLGVCAGGRNAYSGGRLVNFLHLANE